jgi:hypothetical protein
MTDLPIVDDDFLSEEEIERYKKYFLGHPSKIKWAFMPKTSISIKKYSSEIESKVYESGSFTHFLMWNKSPNLNGHGKEEALEILSKFSKKHGLDVSEIIRAKVNLTTRASSEDSQKFYSPHVDIDSKHYGFIYYLNDSDGDTVFFNKHYPESSLKESDAKEVIRVSPKAGRAILFDGLQYHAGSPCVDNDFRALINIDFK